MIRSLTIAALVAILGATPNVAAAQSVPPNAPATSDAATPHAHHIGKLARALRELDLSPEQRERARSAMQAYRASKSTATPETRAQLRANLETILTPEQRTQFEATMHARAPKPDANPA